MRVKRTLFLSSLLCCLILILCQPVYGYPSSNFKRSGNDWYDDWGISRTYYGGPDGYLSNLDEETLGENRELAYELGLRFQSNYADRTQRAEAILKFVQTWTEYGYDEDNVVMGDQAQVEWAWNADEMAHAFNTETGVIATGDCEDMAFLCGTMYVAAGFEAAIVDAPSHASLVIWLPEYDSANNYWDLSGDDRGTGWIWVEPTGDSNPLGWTPPDYQGGGWTTYGIGSLNFVAEAIPSQTDWGSSGSGLFSFNSDILMIIVGIVISIVLSLLRSRRR